MGCRWLQVPTCRGGDDSLGIGFPGQGPGVLIMLLDEVGDGGLQHHHGLKDAALKLATGESCVEASDPIPEREAASNLGADAEVVVTWQVQAGGG